MPCETSRGRLGLSRKSAGLFIKAGNTEAELALQQALGELPDEQREVVMMRIWSGMTLEEIGTATGVTLNTAASRYRYALQKLRQLLKRIPKN